jgi:hypothetical protein
VIGYDRVSGVRWLHQAGHTALPWQAMPTSPTSAGPVAVAAVHVPAGSTRITPTATCTGCCGSACWVAACRPPTGTRQTGARLAAQVACRGLSKPTAGPAATCVGYVHAPTHQQANTQQPQMHARTHAYAGMHLTLPPTHKTGIGHMSCTPQPSPCAHAEHTCMLIGRSPPNVSRLRSAHPTACPHHGTGSTSPSSCAAPVTATA